MRRIDRNFGLYYFVSTRAAAAAAAARVEEDRIQFEYRTIVKHNAENNVDR